MNEDLLVSQKLDDESGQCRAHGNLGVAYFSKGNYQLAEENHSKQLSLAQSLQVGYLLTLGLSFLPGLPQSVKQLIWRIAPYNAGCLNFKISGSIGHGAERHSW